MIVIESNGQNFVNVASLKTNNIENSSLTETMHKLYKMKQIRAKQFIIMLPLCAAWFVWTGIEMWQFTPNISEMDELMRGAAYGGIGGLMIVKSK